MFYTFLNTLRLLSLAFSPHTIWLAHYSYIGSGSQNLCEPVAKPIDVLVITVISSELTLQQPSNYAGVVRDAEL